jgi:hypothetical protein
VVGSDGSTFTFSGGPGDSTDLAYGGKGGTQTAGGASGYNSREASGLTFTNAGPGIGAHMNGNNTQGT